MTYRTDYNITRPCYLTVRKRFGGQGKLLGIFYYDFPLSTFSSRRKEFESACAFFEMKVKVKKGVPEYKRKSTTISKDYIFRWEDQEEFSRRMKVEESLLVNHGIDMGYPKMKYVKDIWEFYKIIGYNWKKRKIDNSVVLEDYFS